MTTITLKTQIEATTEQCFDLSINIDVHLQSMKKSRERAIAGKLHGNLELGEWVTWEATHFWIRWKLTTKITSLIRPKLFTDEAVGGVFRYMKHDHHFEEFNGGTLMTDIFHYEPPFGQIGKAANIIFLKNHMTSLLSDRNRFIKGLAEG